MVKPARFRMLFLSSRLKARSVFASPTYAVTENELDDFVTNAMLDLHIGVPPTRTSLPGRRRHVVKSASIRLTINPPKAAIAAKRKEMEMMKAMHNNPLINAAVTFI